jgi:polyisoprenoid-binding protein YceI
MTDTHAAARRIDIPAAGRYGIDPARSSVTLRTRLFGLHPLTASMSVYGGQLDVDPAVPRASVTAAISAASFTTDNPRRDHDIRSPRFFFADEYPELSFQAGRLSQDRGRWTLSGELTVREVTRPVALEIDSVQRAGKGFLAHASTRIDRVDFGLTIARWMGGRIYDVELTVAAEPR